jgi:hypothetical protein
MADWIKVGSLFGLAALVYGSATELEKSGHMILGLFAAVVGIYAWVQFANWLGKK